MPISRPPKRLVHCLCGAAIAAGVAIAAAAEKPSDEDYRQHAMRSEGDVVRGKALFAGERALCATCHATDGKRDAAGPGLAAAGDKFSRADLIRSVMEPSANIMAGYSLVMVKTKSGETFSGIVKSASDTGLVLANAGAARFRIPKADIAEQSTSPVSMMPPDLHAALSKDEFADLIAYLESLKQPESKFANQHGTPLEIPRLAKPVTLVPVFGETLDFEKPVWFGEHPTIDGAFVIAEKSRTSLSLLERGADGRELQSPFVVIPDKIYVTGDEGLLGLAFHPHFAKNRKYYFMHETMDGARRGMKIGEREARVDLRADSGKPTRTILEFEVATQFHHGGGLEFGPDGFLYIGMGDGGPQEDPHGHAQDLTSFSGKLMRIDVDRRDEGEAYAVPPDNPFVDHPDPEVRREIFAYGLRQPWRFSFDPVGGDLWVGDVGQDRFEEVAIVRSGENHGWNVVEGFELFSTQYRKEGERLVPPIVSFRRRHGVSITGGYVYRAPGSSFDGVYVCADYQSKRLWGITQRGRKLLAVREIGSSPDRVVAFGRDRRGGIYAIGYDEGVIYKIDFDGAVFDTAGSKLVSRLQAGDPQTVVTYGTSLTAGGAWVNQLKSALDAAYPGKATVINSGAGGMWSTWGVENLDARVIAKKPDTVLIEFGINDAYLDYKTPVAKARVNLENMIERILEANSDCEIVLMVMNPPIKGHLERRPKIKDYYQMYREVAKERKLLLIDHYPAWEKILNEDPKRFDAYVPDGIHPGPQGCEAVITPAIVKAMGIGGRPAPKT